MPLLPQHLAAARDLEIRAEAHKAAEVRDAKARVRIIRTAGRCRRGTSLARVHDGRAWTSRAPAVAAPADGFFVMEDGRWVRADGEDWEAPGNPLEERKWARLK